ncbi:MAG: hypothetical protein JEZ14_16300 [Marinilabiliaceae bacterium]|nr:hypothetical protein [Marinilabiliaceae bacterium]
MKTCLNLLVLSVITLSAFGQNTDSLVIAPTHAQLMYEGRVDRSQVDETLIYWAGTSIQMKFSGTRIGVILNDEKGENYFQAIVDGIEQYPIVLDCDSAEHFYSIAAGLPAGEHVIELVKRTEPWEGFTGFKGFVLYDDGKILSNEADETMKIEFYGNSITSGMGNEDLSINGRNNQNSFYKNNYLSYAAITARQLNAGYHCVSLSGIGITVSWGDYIMPEIYNRLNPFDASSQWDFMSWIPDVVVVNLFQNDSWLVERPAYDQFKKRFADGQKPTNEQLIVAHQQFIKKLRIVYPKAFIICALGSMDATKAGSVWPGIVQSSVKGLQELGDDKITTFFFDYNGHNGHPTVFHDFQMANELTEFIHNTVLKE